MCLFEREKQTSFSQAHGLRNEVAFGVKRLPDDGRSPQERVVRDRGVRASCVVAPLGEALLTIRRAPSDLQRVCEEQ
jgi:hypothetical protein